MSRAKWLASVAVAMAVALGCTRTVLAQDAQPRLQTSETPVGTLAGEGVVRSVAISADARRVAIARFIDDRMQVTLDGEPGRAYDWIIPPSLGFSADGSVLGYVAQQGDHMIAVINGQDSRPYHEIGGQAILFAPEGARWGYYARASARGPWTVVLDGRESPAYDHVGNLTFSRDGRRVAYGAQRGEQQFFVIDGEEQPAHQRVAGASFTFSPDGQRYAYGVVGDGQVMLVVDGQVQEAVDEAGPPIFSPDSRRIAYTARTGAKTALIVDGQRQAEYDQILGDTVRFSPDGQRIAFIAMRDNHMFYVIDGQETGAYDGLVRGQFLFSPDSRRTAFQAVRDNRLIVVLDGIEGRLYEDIRAMSFSPDSRRLAYLARRDNRAYVVVNGTESAPYEAVANLRFSPEANRLMYVASRSTPAGGTAAAAAPAQRQMFVVLDGVEQRPYEGIVAELAVFSPDGRHIAYEARREDRPVLVVNQLETEPNDGTLRGSRLHFADNNTLNALILRDRIIHRTQIRVPE